VVFFFFSSRRRHTRCYRDWSSDVCSSDLNAQEIMANGAPDESTAKGKIQKALLAAWVELLERENVMENVMASYEVVPLLAQFSRSEERRVGKEGRERRSQNHYRKNGHGAV